MHTIPEPSRDVPISGEYDVVIVGGGVAGIAAALAARRQGAKTLLIEKQFLLGGLATAGLIAIYLPLCDGMGRQVSFGLAEELLRLSVRHGYEPAGDHHSQYFCPAWLEGGSPQARCGERFEVEFNANLFAILCEQQLLQEGITPLYGTSVCGAKVENGRIKALFIENKSGRSAILARSFVDASGDADLCHLAGEHTATFAQGNVLASWYYQHVGRRFALRMLGFADIPDKYKQPGTVAEKGRRYTGLDAQELSEMTCASHANILADFLSEGGISPDHALANIATTPQVRMTRRLDGACTLDDTQVHIPFEDSIGMIGDWRKPGPVYELPYRTLYGNHIANLCSAGRCISVTDAMWDISRVIPACAVTGQAAGTAAALTGNFAALSVPVLQAALRKAGVPLHEGELAR